MAYKSTGRPMGRPPKDPEAHAAKQARQALPRSPKAAVFVAEVFGGLTDEQIDATSIQGLSRMLIQVAIKAGDMKMLQQLVLGLMPYEMARKSETITLTPEELRRVAATAKSEAIRRGLVIDVTERRAA